MSFYSSSYFITSTLFYHPFTNLFIFFRARATIYKMTQDGQGGWSAARITIVPWTAYCKRELESMRVYEDQNLEIAYLARPTREYEDSIDDNTIRIELETYSSILRKNPVHIDSNPLEFWNKSQLVLPKLARLARRPFSLVPISIASEHLFSKAGILYGNTLRNRLTGVKAEKLLFLQAMLHSSASRSIRTYNSKCVQLLVDYNDQTADDAYSDEYESDISEEL
uniref:Dimer_Tnp_hAT domain-containing protein n=1 Tax=Heterorhabditis bacteriophora TaxID=37862 RepID=A0A1I7WQN7_HETBA